jgi:hypothetical protein
VPTHLVSSTMRGQESRHVSAALLGVGIALTLRRPVPTQSASAAGHAKERTESNISA